MNTSNVPAGGSWHGGVWGGESDATIGREEKQPVCLQSGKKRLKN